MREKDFDRLQQMMTVAMGANQSHQAEMIAAKQAELDRTRDDANLNQDRMLAGVQSAVTAAGVAFSGYKNGQGGRAAVRKDATATRTCANCGAALEPEASFCGECGTAV